MNPDTYLLEQYAEAGDQRAFTELVRRNLRLVYATALRVGNGDAALAEDVAQTVFADLARKAGALRGHTLLTGWLHTSARFAAAKAVRAARIRRKHEQEAATMHDTTSDQDAAWGQMRPLLDAAVGRLKEGEREAVLLRFFAERSHQEVGEALGLSENAARMRVERGLDKLRDYFARRGVSTSAALLASTLGARAGEGVPPANLAESVAGNSLAGAGAATGGSAGGSRPQGPTVKWLTAVLAVVMAGGLATVHWTKPKLVKPGPAAPAAATGVAANPVRALPAAGSAMALTPAVAATAAVVSHAATAAETKELIEEAKEEAQDATETDTTDSNTTPNEANKPVTTEFATWSQVARGEMKWARYAGWIRKQFVVVGAGPLLTSPDGVNWIEHAVSTGNPLYGVATNGVTNVAVGEKGTMLISRSMNGWRRIPMETAVRFYDVIWTGERFVALGDAGTVATSADGETWSLSHPASANGAYFHGGTWTGRQFVVTSYNGIFTSPDGENWAKTQHSPPRMFGVAWNKALFVAVGALDVYNSPDGVNWNLTGDELLDGGHVSVIWTGREFVTVGGGSVDSSPDGEVWQMHPMGTRANLFSVAEHQGILVVGASSGEIYTNQTAPEE